MGKRTRRSHSPAFKAKVALEALREQESVAEIARRHKLHGNLVASWKRQLAENVARVFETSGDHDGSERESELLQKIGELTVGRVFSQRARAAATTARRRLVGPDERISVRRQTEYRFLPRATEFIVGRFKPL